jgi:hypothetical protein
MNVYIVKLKEKKDQSYWDQKDLIIVAANYAAAEDKAKNFDESEIVNISLFAETTRKDDVFRCKSR